MSHYGFDRFIAELEHIVPRSSHQHELVQRLVPSMQKLLSNEALLPHDFLRALIAGHHDGRVYTSPEHGFFVQVFAWSPGANTPVHDHKTWGLMGIYQNQLEITEYFVHQQPETGTQELELKQRFNAGRGMIACVTSPDDEIHDVRNPSQDYSFSIHVYGAELHQTDYYDSESRRFYQPI